MTNTFNSKDAKRSEDAEEEKLEGSREWFMRLRKETVSKT